MSINYTGRSVGQIKVMQNDNVLKLDIRQSNCFFCCIYCYKKSNPEDPSKPWVHQLVCFFLDYEHMKRCMKMDSFSSFFYGDIKEVKLNLAYKDNLKLLPYVCQSVSNVKVYYKEIEN